MWNLSAVDAHVGKHLFEECITTFLRNKVVILVTHQIQYLKTADNILVLHQGRVSHEGNFDYIMKSCEDISSFLIAESDEEEEDDKETKQVEITEGNSQPVKINWNKKLDSKQKTSQIFNIDAKGFRKTRNKNALMREARVTS